MFDNERFIEDCRAAARDADAHAAIREIVARAVSDPAQVVRGFGEPTRSGVETIYRGDDITILNLSWGPQMYVRPHDHRVWAVIDRHEPRSSHEFGRSPSRGLDRDDSVSCSVDHDRRDIDSSEVRAEILNGGFDLHDHRIAAIGQGEDIGPAARG